MVYSFCVWQFYRRLCAFPLQNGEKHKVNMRFFYKERNSLVIFRSTLLTYDKYSFYLLSHLNAWMCLRKTPVILMDRGTQGS